MLPTMLIIIMVATLIFTIVAGGSIIKNDHN